MMASFMNYFGGRRDPKASARDAIVGLRQQLQMIEKKEEHLMKKIDDEQRKAKANVTSNKAAATAALRNKKRAEGDLERLSATKIQLETQVSTLENANLNAETMLAMKKATDALKVIHGNTSLKKVDDTMADMADQTAIANEISSAISNPVYGGLDIDETDLAEELAELEQDQLNERLMGAERAPMHVPAGANKVEDSKHKIADEDDEEAQLRQLQAELAM
jgi:charged multivesicular body protein 4